MKKEQEIATLRTLEGDTYFSQYFSHNDIEQMCENIKNDFPIEYGTHFTETVAQLMKELNTAKVKAQEELEDMVANCIKLNTMTEDFYHYCAERVGKIFIIKCKRQYGMLITDEELDYLIRITDKHINPDFSNNK